MGASKRVSKPGCSPLSLSLSLSLSFSFSLAAFRLPNTNARLLYHPVLDLSDEFKKYAPKEGVVRELEEDAAHLFLERRGETMTVVELRDGKASSKDGDCVCGACGKGREEGLLF